MKSFASYLMRGRAQAILVAVITWVMGLIMPPLNMITGSIVGLVTLRKGAVEGLIVLTVIAMLISGVAFMSKAGSHLALPLLGSIGLILLPVWFLAAVLRTTISLAFTVTVAALLGCLGVIAVYLMLGDPAAWWYNQLNDFLGAALQRSGMISQNQLDQGLKTMAGVMTGFVMSALILSSLFSLFIARWFQSLLYNPHGFRQEVYELRLGNLLAVVSIIVIAASIFLSGSIRLFALDLLIVLGTVYLLQGTALIHAVLNALGKSKGWLVALYIILFIIPHAVLLVAALGLLDRWMNFRGRVGHRT